MKKKDKLCSCSRRSFLKGSGLTLAGFSVASLFPGALIRHAMANPTNDGRFMFIFLRGGNDGVNTVIPHGDPDYNPTNRAGVYIGPSVSIDLNGFASFHPALADMMDAFNAGDLALVHCCGFPGNSRSHFEDQRIWENGDPTQPSSFEGWLARYMLENAVSANLQIPAISVQSNQPVLLRGDEEYINIADPDNFNFALPFLGEPLRTKVINAWPPHFAGLTGLEPYGPILSDTGVKLAAFVDEFGSWDQENWDPKDPDNPSWSLFPVNLDTNPYDPDGPNGRKFSPESYDFFRNLKVCALALLESDPLAPNGPRVVGTELQGFDLHSGQGSVNGRHHELLSWVGYGYRSLRIALSGAAIDPRGYSSVWERTVVSTLSEFGRTSRSNGSIGTDHAGGNCVLIQGGPVNGGVYNCDSSIWVPGTMFMNLGRGLPIHTDFRALFWEILRDHMGADPTTVDLIFPGYTAQGLASQEPGVISTV